jgi:hypothetical protein
VGPPNALREVLDAALALWEGRPDTAGVFPGVYMRFGQWRRVREALAKS